VGCLEAKMIAEMRVTIEEGRLVASSTVCRRRERIPMSASDEEKEEFLCQYEDKIKRLIELHARREEEKQ
jgi:hypothetical protein